MPRRERALTLVESFLIVGIVVVLGGFILTTIDQARERVRRQTCFANLHALSKAFAMYVEDYNGVFPLNLPQTREYYGWEHPWPAQIATYLNDRQAFRCQSDPTEIVTNPAAKRGEGRVTSYVMNQSIGWKRLQMIDTMSALKYSDISKPAETMLLVDREAWHFRKSRRYTHRNLLFVDGKVRALNDESVRDMYWGQLSPSDSSE
ncbi:MAG: hypothetical protein Q7N50_05315 [Armatimonadota bacterium]|nr:hypothetical protein [Armatimonadota bacterium]